MSPRPLTTERAPLDPFETRYRLDPDPWAFETSPYEQRRYDLTVAALLRPHYASAFEPACSIGELTRRLARRADRVVALDPSPSVIERARDRLAAVGNVEFRVGAVPEAWPVAERFELVVLSEIGYYFPPDGIDQLAALTDRSLAPGGEIVAVHWRGHSDDHLTSGDTVHERLTLAFGPPTVRYEQREFRLDGWSRS